MACCNVGFRKDCRVSIDLLSLFARFTILVRDFFYELWLITLLLLNLCFYILIHLFILSMIPHVFEYIEEHNKHH